MNEKAEQEREGHRAHVLSLIGGAGVAGKESAAATDELKPCPFCNGEATIVISHSDKYYITCCQCRAQTQRWPKHLAIAAWNRRPANAHDELVTAAKHLIKELNDWALDCAREGLGNTNVACIQNARDKLSALVGVTI